MLRKPSYQTSPANFPPRPHSANWRPRLSRRHPERLHLRGAVLVVVSYFALKSMLVAAAGPADYDRRVDLMAESTPFDAAASWAMTRDRVSDAGATLLSDLLR